MRLPAPPSGRALAQAALAGALILAALAPPLVAGTDEPGLTERLETEGRDLSLAEWRALTNGRTVWYRIDGELWGRESYRQDGRVTFQFPDGECLDAAWDYQDPWFCFDFGQALGGVPHCFRHIRLEDRLYALGRSGAPQAIDRIDGAPIACGPSPSS
ncbi:MAG: hypothetical protein VYD87_15185 [Pseudomonadota bacterium]|nr:hypothetical protein [Pseudomonadota bacterium]MEE3099161.1 hypothetical protein [Pseudomonadota bacterium]